MHIPLLPIAFGKTCPDCARRTERTRFPALLSPLRTLALGHLTYRECVGCSRRRFYVHRERSARGIRTG